MYKKQFKNTKKINLKKIIKQTISYHGLVMENSEPGGSMEVVLKRIESAMDKCRKEKKNSDSRDFMLLVAQVRVMEEMYFNAIEGLWVGDRGSDGFQVVFVPRDHLHFVEEQRWSGEKVWAVWKACSEESS